MDEVDGPSFLVFYIQNPINFYIREIQARLFYHESDRKDIIRSG